MRRPWGVVLASILTAGSGVGMAVLAVLSGLAGHGQFSGGVAVMLGIYALGLFWAAWGMWRMSMFARGPILATALLQLAVLSGYLTGPSSWVAYLLAVVPLLTGVAVMWPSTRTALLDRGADAQNELDPAPTGTEPEPDGAR